jgi:hypothetical protein
MTPPCTPCQAIDCVLPNDFAYTIPRLPVLPSPVPPYGNDELTYCCPAGQTLTFTGTLPAWLTIGHRD